MRRIAYGKIGRTISFNPEKWGAVGGDNEPPIMALELLRRNPDIELVLMSRCQDPPATLPARVINPWEGHKMPTPREETGHTGRYTINEHRRCATEIYERVLRDAVLGCQDIIMWAGQHSSANTPIPPVDNPFGMVHPQDSTVQYGGPVTLMINEWRDTYPDREPIWLCSDVRNYIKARDLKHPLLQPVLSQQDQTRAGKHYRWGFTEDPPAGWEWDPFHAVWVGEHQYKYADLELCGVPEPRGLPFRERDLGFGVFVNETRIGVANSRLELVKKWVFPLDPDYVYGGWSKKSLADLGVNIEPLHWSKVPAMLERTRYTITMPGSGAGWATAKPWECFGAGVICFFHPGYDTQNHILGDSQLRDWLWVSSPEDMQLRIDALERDPGLASSIRTLQYELFERRYNQKTIYKEVEARWAA
jgi:hypothetical protein